MKNERKKRKIEITRMHTITPVHLANNDLYTKNRYEIHNFS